MTSTLFQPLKVGAMTLPNRIVMAPLTRCRADAQHVPTELMVEYYTQRATAGMIVCEATMVSEGHSAFNAREPGVYSAAQVAGWRKVTESVHAAGGRIVLQIWHGGRSCHSELGGKQPVAPSAIAINGTIHVPGKGKLPYEVPRELNDSELPEIVADFRRAARNAVDAGFDAVELHGANGYLLNQFLCSGSNKRTGPYGGSLENRTRLLLEVVDAVVAEIGADRVGLRISPVNSISDMSDEDPLGLTERVASEVAKRGLAYLHLMRADFLGLQKADVVSVARKHFPGPLILNMGFTAAEAADAISASTCDAVAMGRPFIANPTLVDKIRRGAALADPNPQFFYTHDAQGYSDYV